MLDRACPVCKGSDITRTEIESVQGSNRFQIVECRTCTHRYIAHAPSAEQLASLYDEYYRDDTRRTISRKTSWRDRALARILIKTLPDRAAILEVGSNFGQTLSAFPHNYRLVGVELSSSAADASRTSSRIEILHGFFEELDLPNQSFDCVLALAVIEHVRDPIVFLEKAASVLKPGGSLVLMTGDHSSWYARKRGSSWPLYHDIGHLHFFSRQSLEKTLLFAGFEPSEWLWSGPTPLTQYLPTPIAGWVGSQALAMSFPWIQARRPFGPNMYCWAAKPHE